MFTPGPGELLLLFLVAAGLLTTGCRPQAEPPPGPPKTGLVATLSLDRQQVRPGESVQLTLLVENRGPHPVPATFRSGQSFDFLVREERGEVWRWSHDRVFTLALRQPTLPPGWSETYQANWEGKDNEGRPVKPGDYQVLGIFTISPPLISKPVTLHITQ